MANFKNLAWLVLVVMGLVAAMTPETEAAMGCQQVYQSLYPCIDYIRSNGMTKISPTCCSGIRTLYSEATTTPDRQAVCRCLKTAASAAPGLNIGLASSIPTKCGINIPYKLDPSTDCNKIH